MSGYTLNTGEGRGPFTVDTQGSEGKTIYANSLKGVVLPREVVSWLHLLRLPQKVKLPKRDLSNGYVIAHICSFYWPEVNLHSFRNGLSKSIKRENWELLQKAFHRNGIPLSKNVIEGMIQSKDGYAENFLRQLYTLLTGKEIREEKPLRLPVVEAEIYNPGALAQQMKSTMEAYQHLTTEEENRKRGLPRTDPVAGKPMVEGPGGAGGISPHSHSVAPSHWLDPGSSPPLRGGTASSFPSMQTEGIKPIRTYHSLDGAKSWIGSANYEEGDNHDPLRANLQKEGLTAENSHEMGIDERTGFEFAIEVRPSHCTSTVLHVPSCFSPLTGGSGGERALSSLHSSPSTAEGMGITSNHPNARNKSRARQETTLLPSGPSLKPCSVKEWVEDNLKTFADDGWRLHSDCPTYMQFLLQHEDDMDGATQGAIWNLLISQIGYLVELMKNQSEALKELVELMLVTPEAVRTIRGEGGINGTEKDPFTLHSPGTMQSSQVGGPQIFADGVQEAGRQRQRSALNLGSIKTVGHIDTFGSINGSISGTSPASGGMMTPPIARTSAGRRSNTPVVTSPRVFMFIAAALSHLTEMDPHYALSAFSAALLSFPTIQSVLRRLNTHLADMYASLFCALISSDLETALTLLPDLLSAVYECITVSDSTPEARISYLILLQAMIRRLFQRGYIASSTREAPHGSGRTGARPHSSNSPSLECFQQKVPAPSSFRSPSSKGNQRNEANRSVGSARWRENNGNDNASQRTASAWSTNEQESKGPTRYGSIAYTAGNSVGGTGEHHNGGTPSSRMAPSPHEGPFHARSGQSAGQRLFNGIHAIATMHAVVALSSECSRLRMAGASLMVTLAQTGYPAYDSIRHFRNVLFPSLPSVLPFCMPRVCSSITMHPFSNIGPALSPIDVVLRAIWLQTIIEQLCTEDSSLGIMLRNTGSRSSATDLQLPNMTSSFAPPALYGKVQDAEQRTSSRPALPNRSSEGSSRERGGGRVGAVLNIPVSSSSHPAAGVLEACSSMSGSDDGSICGGFTAQDIIRDLLPLFHQMCSHLMQPGGHRKSKGIVAFELALSLPFLPLTRLAIKQSSMSTVAGSHNGPSHSFTFSASPPTLSADPMPPLPPNARSSMPTGDEVAAVVMSFFVKQCSPDMIASLVAQPTEQSYTATLLHSNISGSGSRNSKQKTGGGSNGKDNDQGLGSKNGTGAGGGGYPSNVVSSFPSNAPSTTSGCSGGGGGGANLSDMRNCFLNDPLLGSFGVENMLCRTSSVLLCRALYKNVLPYTGDMKDAVRRLGVRAANMARERGVPPDVRCRLDWLFWINVRGRGLHMFPEENTFISKQEMRERWRDVFFDCYDDIAVVTSAGATVAAQQQRLHTDEQMQSLIQLSYSARRVVFRWYTELGPSILSLSDSSASSRPRSRSKSGSARRNSGRARGEDNDEEVQKRRKELLVDPATVLEETPEKLEQAMDWYHTNFNSNIRQEG